MRGHGFGATPAPSATGVTRPTTVTTIPTGTPAAAVGAPYTGPLANVVEFDDDSILSPSGCANWNASIGISPGSGGCPVPSGKWGSVLSKVSALVGSSGAVDAVANRESALVSYLLPGDLLKIAKYPGQIHPEDVADSGGVALSASSRGAFQLLGGYLPLANFPVLLSQADPRAAVRLALWLLLPTINQTASAIAAAVTITGNAVEPVMSLIPAALPIVDSSHDAFRRDAADAAAQLLAIVSATGALGRAFSAGTQAFVDSGAFVDFVKGAPAIVVDLTQAVTRLRGATGLKIDTQVLGYPGGPAFVLSLVSEAPANGGVGTGDGANDWNRSVGSAVCASTDKACTACLSGADALLQYQPTGRGTNTSSGKLQALVCYGSSEYAGQVNAKDFQDANNPPAVLMKPGMEAKLGLWLLEPTVNKVVAQLATIAGSPTTVPAIATVNSSHLYLTDDDVGPAATALAGLAAGTTGGYLPRPLSAGAQAFLGNPNLATLAANAPAIVFDLLSAQVSLAPKTAATAVTNSTSGKQPSFPAGTIAVLDPALGVYHVFIPPGTAISGLGASATTAPSGYPAYTYATDVPGPPAPLPPNVTAVAASSGLSTAVWIGIGVGALVLVGGVAWWLKSRKKSGGLAGDFGAAVPSFKKISKIGDPMYRTEDGRYTLMRSRWRQGDPGQRAYAWLWTVSDRDDPRGRHFEIVHASSKATALQRFAKFLDSEPVRGN